MPRIKHTVAKSSTRLPLTVTFVQVTHHGRTLYGLDRTGRVWEHRDGVISASDKGLSPPFWQPLTILTWPGVQALMRRRAEMRPR